MVRVNRWGFVLFIDEDWAREKERGHDGRVVVSAILSNSLDIEPIRISGVALDEANSRGIEYDVKLLSSRDSRF